MKTQFFLAALATAAAVAGAAFAGPLDTAAGAPGGHSPVKVLVIVSSHGLDLASDAGADRFLDRLSAAVDRACNDRPANGPALSMARTPGFYACRAQAIGTAMTYVHSPIVKRRYAAIEARRELRLARR